MDGSAAECAPQDGGNAVDNALYCISLCRYSRDGSGRGAPVGLQAREIRDENRGGPTPRPHRRRQRRVLGRSGIRVVRRCVGEDRKDDRPLLVALRPTETSMSTTGIFLCLGEDGTVSALQPPGAA